LASITALAAGDVADVHVPAAHDDLLAAVAPPELALDREAETQDGAVLLLVGLPDAKGLAVLAAVRQAAAAGAPGQGAAVVRGGVVGQHRPRFGVGVPERDPASLAAAQRQPAAVAAPVGVDDAPVALRRARAG
jgi:hypothetical protein